MPQLGGGDWVIETSSGHIDASAFLQSAGIADYKYMLATFDFEANTSGTGTASVSQTVGGITLTATINGGQVWNIVDNVNDLGVAATYNGTSTHVLIDSGLHSLETFIFNHAVDLTSFRLTSQSVSNALIFTPTGGSNSVVNATAEAITGQTIALNWVGVTSFTVTKAGNVSFTDVIYDSFIFTPPTITYDTTTFTEAAANDGSITTSTITLTNDTFTGANGAALGAVTNVPAGLTAVLVKASATTATLSLTGNATAHANANDISTLTVAFTNGYFNGGSAAAIAGATNNNLVVDFADSTAPTISLSVNNASIAEAAGVSTVTATLSSAASTDTTVTLAATGTATGSGTDYTLSSTTITILAGQTTGTATVTAAQDTLDEVDETVILDISAVSGGDGATENGTQQQTVTITDDDAPPTVTLSVSPTGIAEAAGSSTVTATLSTASSKAITVTLTPTGTATGGGTDYTLASTTINIAAGQTTGTTTVTAVQDTAVEGTETIILDITGVTNGTESGTQQQTISITDDDGPTVASVVRAASAATLVAGSASSVDYTVTFSEAVTGVDASDFTLTKTGTANGAISNVTGSGTSWTVTVDTLSGDGSSGDTFTYSLITGTGDTDNASFNISSSDLRATTPSGLSAGSYSVRVRSTDAGGNFFDKAFTITVSSNAAPVVSTPTSINLADTAAADTFANQTGTLSATDIDGITGGTAGGSDLIGGVTYDVSKIGTYGTLYVVSTGTDIGKYVYVVNATAIDALSANANETFTVNATDGNATGTATLTVNVTGVNDTPTLATPTSASYTDTAANDSFTNNTGTLSGSGRDGNIFSAGLVAYWKFDEGTGTTPADSSGHNINGVFTTPTPPTWSTDRPAAIASWDPYSLDFSRTGDGVSFSWPAGFNLAQRDPRAFSFWYKPTANGEAWAGNYDRIISTNTVYEIAGTRGDVATHELTFHDGNWRTTNYAMTVNTWYHITLTYDGTDVKLYADDLLKYSAASNGLGISGSITVGTTDNNHTEGINGLIDDVRVYNTALTAAQIATLTTGGSGSLTYGISGGTVSSGTSTLAGSYGSLSVNTSSGAYTYTPSASAINALSGNATDTFTVSVSDGTASTTAAYRVDLAGVNDAPTANNKTVSINEDTAYTFAASNFNFNDVDTGDTLSAVRIDTLPGTGSLKLGSDVVTAGQSISAANIGNLTYTPVNNANGTGYASFTFSVKDTTGGAFAASASTMTIDVTAINDAPTLTASTTHTLTSTDENTTSSGTLVSNILTTGGLIDVDTSAVSGLAVTATTGNGTWQYSTNGTTWTDFGTVSTTGALLLTSTTQTRYIPDNNNGESATFTYCAWDQTTGTASINGTARTADPSTNGNTTAFSINTGTASLTVTSVNDAPTITGATASQAVNDNATNTPFSGVTIGDVDSPAQTQTITVTLDNQLKGALSNLGNGSYNAATGVYSFSGTATQAQTAIRGLVFTPTANRVNPTLTEVTTFTISVNDGIATAVTNNNTTVISTSINDAPSGVDNLTLATINEDTANPTGTDLTGYTFHDVDTNATSPGILVVGNTANTSTEGVWQYSSNAGTNWKDIGTVNDNTAALALAPATYLRFVPVANFNGTPTSLSIRALDNNYGAAFSTTTNGTETRVTANSSINGGDTAISANINTISASITAINDIPSFTKGADQAINEDAGAQTVSGWATSLSKGPANESSQTLSFTASNTNNALFSVQPTIDSSGNLSYTPAANANGSATVTVSIKDSGGTANGGIDTSASQIFAITVNPVNDLPSGAVTINGTPTSGKTLTAANTLTDIDGLGAIGYLWQEDGANINGATGSSFTLSDAQAGKTITVTAHYTDAQGANESVSSAETTPVVLATSTTVNLSQITGNTDSKPSSNTSPVIINNNNATNNNASTSSNTGTSNSNTNNSEFSSGNTNSVSSSFSFDTGNSNNNSSSSNSGSSANQTIVMDMKLSVDSGGNGSSGGTISIPSSAFAGLNTSGLITITAAQSSGQSLPSFISVNPSTGAVTVKEGAVVTSPITVKVTIRDAQGKQVVVLVKVQPQKGKVQQEKQGQGQQQQNQQLEQGDGEKNQPPADNKPQAKMQQSDKQLALASRPGLTQQLQMVGSKGFEFHRQKLLDSLASLVGNNQDAA